MIAKKSRCLSGGYTVGDLRVSYTSVPCGTMTIFAQQYQVDGNFFFRPFNPFKLKAPPEDSTDPDQEKNCGAENLESSKAKFP